MKIRNVILKTLIAVFVIIVGGNVLTFISSEPATVRIMPFYEDVSDENRKRIENLYMNDLMSPESDVNFGVDKPVTASELAFLGVGLYEIQNNASRSYTKYENDADYISKASEYGLWNGIGKNGAETVTRAEMAAVIAPLASAVEQIEYYTGFIGMESNPFSQSVLELYNRGIALDTGISIAYSTETAVTRDDIAKLVEMIAEPSLRLTKLMPDYIGMKTMLETMMNSYQGDWSLYFEAYDSNDVISINSHQVYSASLIKLFVAQAVYTRIADGTLADTDSIENNLFRMITISDNDAWRTLARVLGNGSYMRGMASVTEIAGAAGFADSGQFMQGSRKNYNFTSVNDCGVYLRKVLNGEIVSPAYSEKILNLLKQQQIKFKIPSGVPEGVVVANKTGELEYIQGDAAIIYAPSGTYILVVIGDGLENPGIAQSQIRELSKAVYEFLNN